MAVPNRRALKLLYFHFNFSSYFLPATLTGSLNVFEDTVTKEGIKDGIKSPMGHSNSIAFRISLGVPIVF